MTLRGLGIALVALASIVAWGEFKRWVRRR